jgi:hypothetical protein
VRSSSSISRTGAPVSLGLQRLQQRPADEEARGVDVVGQPLAVVHALGFGQPDLDHLARVVPFVDGGGDVEALVALQADELAAERLRQHLGDLGLADAGLALEEQRPAHAQAEEDDGGERPVGDVAGAGEKPGGFVDGGGEGAWHGADMADRLCLSNRPAPVSWPGLTGPPSNHMRCE